MTLSHLWTGNDRLHGVIGEKDTQVTGIIEFSQGVRNQSHLTFLTLTLPTTFLKEGNW